MIATDVAKMHENVFPDAHCYEHFRVLSETSLRVKSYCATFLMNFTHWFSCKIKNCKL